MPARVPWNTYRVDGEIAYIEMREGHEAIIDADDLDRARTVNWTARVRNRQGKRTGIYVHQIGHFDVHLHHFIARAARGQIVDHINHNPLDNRKANLRLVTNSENMQNRPAANRNSKSGVRGVSPWSIGGRNYWMVRVWLPPSHPSGKKSMVRYFPQTDEGLANAAKTAEAIRAEYMTHSEACS